MDVDDRRTIIEIPKRVTMLILDPSGVHSLATPSTRGVIYLPAELVEETLQVLLLH